MARKEDPAGAGRQAFVAEWRFTLPKPQQLPSLRQLQPAVEEALPSPDIRVTRLGLEIIWRRLLAKIGEASR